MLRYHDPEGAPVSRDRWRLYFAHPELRRPDRLVATPRLAVDVIWVGVSLPHETPPLPYLVEEVDVDDGNADQLRARVLGWFPDKASALAAARRRAREAEKAYLEG